MDVKGYKVICKDLQGCMHEVQLMSTDETAAKHSAEYTLKQLKGIATVAIEAFRQDKIEY